MDSDQNIIIPEIPGVFLNVTLLALFEIYNHITGE